jgi:WD40 repeat protein
VLAAGARTPGLELWNLRDDGREAAAGRIFVPPGDEEETIDSRAGFVAFSPDGRLIACAGHGKDIAVFDVASGELHRSLKGHIHPATAAAFLPDGRLVSGGEERTTRLWDIDRGELLATWISFPADEKQNWADEWVGFSPDGRFVGSAPLDRLVGWQSQGSVFLGAEDGVRRRVEGLFQD